jgi:nucleoside-diphosphate-sugar epimerase
MITHVLVGYGYCASKLAHKLLANQHKVLAISRQPPLEIPKNLIHLQADISKIPVHLPAKSILYYFVPPQGSEIKDQTLNFFLNHLNQSPSKIIYVGSSGIYGQHHGDWVDETSSCHIQSLRQIQRQNHEQQLMIYAKMHQVCCALLRTAGIYGSDRLPLDAARSQMPLIAPNEAPWINHIFINDLVNILTLLGEKHHFHGQLNIADGQPQPMGSLQQICAKKLGYLPAPLISFAESFAQASNFKREFMTQNKRLNTQRLQQLLQPTPIRLTPMNEAITQSLKSMQLI